MRRDSINLPARCQARGRTSRRRSILRRIRGVQEIPACSEVTRVEIVRGLRRAERTRAERLFQTIRWIPVDEPISRRAGELGRRWDRHRPAISLADLGHCCDCRAARGTARYDQCPALPDVRNLAPALRDRPLTPRGPGPGHLSTAATRRRCCARRGRGSRGRERLILHSGASWCSET